MRYLIDGRVFLDRVPGGVTRVAEGLIPAIVQAAPNDPFTLATTGVGVQRPDFCLRETSLPSRHIPIPNKLVALATWAGVTSFDRFVPGTFDALFLPNLEMVGKPLIPYALLVHDVSFFIEPRWFIPKTRLWHHVARAKEVIQGAAALLTVSERTKADLVRLLHISPEKIQTIPLGSPRHSPSLPDAKNPSPYFLVLGGNDPRKNASCVLAAFEELRKTIDARLVVVGAGLKPTSPGVSFISRPTDEHLNDLMRDASALLYPSWYEGFGLPLQEAARYATPIIASTAGALPETAPPGTLFVPPFKPHLWVQVMRANLREPRPTTIPPSEDWLAAGKMVAACLQRIAS